MEGKENIDNDHKRDEEVGMDGNGTLFRSGCFADPRLLGEDESGLTDTQMHENVLSDVPESEVTAVAEEDLPTQAVEVESIENDSVDPTDDDILIYPKPEIAITNPLLQSVLEISPPTPRDSSPLQLAIDEIHPPKVDEDDHLTSPTERKEEEVQLPTGICQFPLTPEDDDKMEEEEKRNPTSFKD